MQESDIHRVAQAICEALGNRWDDRPETNDSMLSYSGILSREDYREMARAAMNVVAPTFY